MDDGTASQDSPTDQQLAGRFSEVIAPLAPAALRVAAALLGKSEAEDAAQEAILRAWRAWPTLRDSGAARSWLLRITVNVCQEWRRGALGKQLQRQQPLTGEYDELAALQDHPGGNMHASALDLREAVQQLPSHLRLVVALRYYGGMNASEIGTALTIPPSTIRTQLSQAMGMLRDALGVADDSEDSKHNPSVHPEQSLSRRRR